MTSKNKIKFKLAWDMDFIPGKRAVLIDATELEFKQVKNHLLPIEVVKTTPRVTFYRIKP